MDKLSIAPCGVICDIYLGFLRNKDKCVGCNNDGNKTRHWYVCSIKTCTEKNGNDQLLCIDCLKYPCKRIKELNERYLLKYGEDLRKNMEECKEKAMEEFIREQIVKWNCKRCRMAICVHRESCIVCGSVNPYFPMNSK